MRDSVLARTLATVVLLIGCGESATPPANPGVVIAAASAAPNPENVLSAIVSVALTGADSARVTYTPSGGTSEQTPYVRVPDDGALRVALVGLSPSATYSAIVEAVGPGSASAVPSSPVSFSTGELPAFLRTLSFTVTGNPSPGYRIASAGAPDGTVWAVAFDGAGAVRWYRHFDEPAVVGDFQQQPNGNFTVPIGSTYGWQPTYTRFLEFTPAGEVVRQFSAPPPLYTDHHELLLTFRDTALEAAHFFAYSLRTVDASQHGLGPGTLLAGHSILRQSASNANTFLWNAWDHVTLDDWIEPPFQAPFDFDHPNSLDIGRDGNFLVSFRNMGEVTKLDSRNGRIIWRLGGRNNQFRFVNDPKNGFSAQHFAREVEDGHVLIYDNGTRHEPPETRVVEYALDTVAKTATLVWEYRHSPPIYTAFMGSAQRLRDGLTFINYSTVGRVAMVNRAGAVQWEGTVTKGAGIDTSYRMLVVPSLYRYERP